MPGRARVDELTLREHRDVEATGLGRHELVGGVLEDREEAQESLRGVADAAGLGQRRLQMGDIRGRIALDELLGEVDLRGEVMEEGALGGSRRGDHLIE